MDVSSVLCLYFSPAGATRSIAKNIAQGMETRYIDMVGFHFRPSPPPGLGTADLVVLAVPAYYGCIPTAATAFLKGISAQGTPVVPVVVYGGKAAGNALLDLRNTALARGFLPMAAGAFAAGHLWPTRSGLNPRTGQDMTNLEKAQAFGFKIRAKLKALDGLEGGSRLRIPERRPGRDTLHQFKEERPAAPETLDDRCTGCGTCAAVCPGRAIDARQVDRIDPLACLLCFSCLRVCPSGAKRIADAAFLDTFFPRAFSTPKNPATYL